MLSRVADSIYWLNRYIERAENVARFVEVNLNLLMDNPVGVAQQWDPLIAVTGDRTLFNERYDQATAERVLDFLTFDTTSPNSIRSCVRAARENARSVRETISSEMWEQVNAFYLQVEDAAKEKDSRDSYEFYSEVKMASHRFAGVMDATLSWNESWQFGQLGRMLERADKTARILDVKYFLLLPTVQEVGTPLDNLQWIALLKSASAYEMYRKTEQMISPAGVAKFLILDGHFPRSIKFCLKWAEDSLGQISGFSGNSPVSSQRALGRLRAQMEYTTLDEIFQQGLHEFLDQLQLQLNQVGECVYTDFIALPESMNPPKSPPMSQKQTMGPTMATSTPS
ncbi:MAG: alpha-E domain-containing protein [Cyanobacteria bacterium J06629_19]